MTILKRYADIPIHAPLKRLHSYLLDTDDPNRTIIKRVNSPQARRLCNRVLILHVCHATAFNAHPVIGFVHKIPFQCEKGLVESAVVR